MKKYYFLFFLLLNVSILIAQTKQKITSWAALTTSYKINDNFSVQLNTQIRGTDRLNGTPLYLIRPMLNYKMDNVTVGYAFTENYKTVSEISGWLPEHRAWEQYVLSQKISFLNRKTALAHRFRLEERFIATGIVDGDRLKKDSYEFALRFRYHIRTMVPFVQKDKFTSGAYVALQNELFMNAMKSEKVTNGKIVDQNRAYVALGWRFSPRFDLEAGYMNQYSIGKVSDVSNNIVHFAGTIRL